MNPQEKAKELVDKFQFILTEKQFGKECALIAVDEIIKHSPNKPIEKFDPIDYFKKVKQEIINL